MTRPEVLRELQAIVSCLPQGTAEERLAKAAERLAVHEDADTLRSVLSELALGRMVHEASILEAKR